MNSHSGHSNSRSPIRGTLPVAASTLAGGALVLQPRILLAMFGSMILGLLTLAAPEIFVGFALIARNVASAAAGESVVAGLNVGAIVGMVVTAVISVRLLKVPRLKGIGITFALVVALAITFIVGYAQFGMQEPIFREMIRSVSIILLAVFVANLPLGRITDRCLSAVVIAASIPALVAVGQLATGDGWGDTARTYGTLGGPNEAASLFTVALAIVVWRMIERSAPSYEYLALALLFGVAVLSTRSLGGMAQVFTTLVCYGLLARKLGRGGRLVGALAIAFIVIFALSPLGRDRLSELPTTTGVHTASRGVAYTTNSVDWRFYNWSAQLDAWRDEPFFGYGLGTTASLVVPGGNIPHSDPIRLLVETGIVGFAFFGAAYLIMCTRLLALIRIGDAQASFRALVLAVVAGLTVHGLVDNVSTQSATMYSAAVLVGCAFARPRSEHT